MRVPSFLRRAMLLAVVGAWANIAQADATGELLACSPNERLSPTAACAAIAGQLCPQAPGESGIDALARGARTLAPLLPWVHTEDPLGEADRLTGAIERAVLRPDEDADAFWRAFGVTPQAMARCLSAMQRHRRTEGFWSGLQTADAVDEACGLAQLLPACLAEAEARGVRLDVEMGPSAP